MANNGLTTPDALAEAKHAVPPPLPPTAVYAIWTEVSFPHVYLDSTILNRQAAIEAFYLGYLEAVYVCKKKKYEALFKWKETPIEEPGYADFVLSIFTSPPPTKKDLNSFKAAALTDTGMDDPEPPTDIDPPTPPKPPPPPM